VTQGAPRPVAEFPERFGEDIGQLMMLPVTPDVFDRVQLGRISRKILQLDQAEGIGNEHPHQAAAVRPAADALGTHLQLSSDFRLVDTVG